MRTIKNMTADQLRKSILQLAIQGKLVKQDPKDEPASVLVDKIYEEKKRLIAEGKIKKEKVESRIFKGDDNRYYEKIGKETKDITDELPFEIPESWEWIRLYNIANIYNGNSINENEKIKKYINLKNGYNYIATKDISFDKIVNYNNGVKIPFETQFKVAPKGNVLLCIEGGSAGRKIALLSEDVCFGNKLACFNNYTNISYYLYLYLQSPTFLQLFKTEVSGIIGGVSINTLKTLFLPLPPLSEQKRIVERIEQIGPLLQQYDKLEKQLTKLENEITNKLKKSILQYAIEGKLVKQDPNDEPASVLLERIKAEKEKLIKEGKIKRDKNESFIYQGDDKNYYEKIGKETKDITNELPFEISNNWEWIRLENIVDIQTGVSFKKEVAIQGDKTGYSRVLRGGNINPFKFELKSDDLYVPSELVNNNIFLQINDLITPAVTSLENIGKIAKINTELENTTIGGFVYLFRPFVCDINISDYLLAIMSSHSFIQFMKNITKKSGQAFYNLNKERLKKLFLPLAPYNEQTRIINKINLLFDTLK